MTGVSNHELATGATHADHRVHLFVGHEPSALCAQARRLTTSAPAFRSAPCDGCLSAALARGHVIAREGGNAFINLRRVGVRV